jgi:hypothetical protein
MCYTDRLLNNPHVEPPTPRDWEVHPTHRVKHVPYYLAPLWDAGLRRQQNERKVAVTAHKAASKTVANKPTAPGVVPKELREKLKRSRGAKGLLMDLEGEVRKFVEDYEAKEQSRQAFPLILTAKTTRLSSLDATAKPTTRCGMRNASSASLCSLRRLRAMLEAALVAGLCTT